MLNRLNVFPISDSDTGTNVELTLARHPRRVAGVRAGRPADDLVQAAVLSAHGNSGAIVAEMLISVSPRALRPERLRRSRGGSRWPSSLRVGGRGGHPGGG